MNFLQLFKAKKQTYFLYILIGIGIFAAYFFIMVNWVNILRVLLGNPNLIYDQQPEFFRFLDKYSGGSLAIILVILFIRGIIKKNLVIPLSVALGFLLSYIGLIAFLFADLTIKKDYIDRIPFDALKWKDEKLVYSRNPIRIRMVDDLLKKHSLVGMTKNEIITLLGVPPQTAYFRNYDYVFWLGPERGIFPIDSEWLVIKFKNDKVVKAKIVTD